MDAFTGEIRMFAFKYAPENWAFCNGTTFSQAQNPALFSIIGTIYGSGSSQTVGLLPNLQGQVPIGVGSGPGLTPHTIGSTMGTETVKLSQGTVAKHTHALTLEYTSTATERTYAAAADEPIANLSLVHSPKPTNAVAYATAAPNTTLSSTVVGIYGGTAAHENRQPVLGMNYCICTSGIYPFRP